MKTWDHFIGYAENIVGNLKSKCRYLCCFKGIVDKFDKEERELLAKQEIITKSIEDAKRNDDVSIRDDVMKWLKQSKDLLKDDTEIKKACFWGWCPNCIWQYRKGKQLAQKTHDIRRLIGVATFEEGVVVAPQTHHHLPGFKPYHNPDFIHFESQNLVYKQLLNELECDDSYMIGLCGMVGTGKTVLAIKMGSQLLESKKIDNLIYIADGHPNIKVIQQKIAEGLGLSLGNKDERERQKLLQKGLMNGGRILIIFDDVWEYINFEEIGIPSRDDDMMNCKILVISQNKRLVKSMGCPKPIQLGLLSDQEEWMLFQRFDIIEDNLDIALLQEIVKECEGLPVAILATGYVNARSVKPLDFYYLYERIKSEEAKKLFLLLSLFPKDTKIPVDMLTRFCNGVGLLIRDVAKYSSVSRSRILEVKDILLDSSLLLEDKEGRLKMHAFLHKVALHIAKEHIQVIKQFDIDHQALVATQEKMKNVRYLCCNDMQVVGGMDVFPILFDVTILEVLLINIEASHHVKVPNEFFEKMTKLQVLFLSSNNTRTPKLGPLVLPPSIRSLTNIRYLLLCHWRLGDISILGKLQSLETLDLDDCTIHELPIEIIRLDKLRVLSLILCEIQKNNPFVVIECLSLKELYFRDNKFPTINNYGNEVEAINHRSGYFPTLDRYHLQGGEASNSKCVCLPSIDALISEATFKYLIRGGEILHLKEMSGEWKNLIPQLVPMEKNECMKDVLDLSLESCPRVECLINTSNCIESPIPSVFTKLVQLKLVNLGSLKELCCGSFPSESLECLVSLSIKYCVNLKGTLLKSELKLCNLKNIEIFRCPKLTSLFQLSIARSLDRLEELIIHDCYLMTSIIGEDNHHESFGLSFPKLKILEIKNFNKLECILPVIFPKAVPLLETIIIDDCIGLKYIFGHYQHEFQDVACGSLQKVKLRDGMSNCFNISLDAVKRSSPRICFKAKQKNSGISISQMSNSECSHNAGGTQCLLEQSPREFNILVLGNIKQLELTYLKEIKYLFALSTASSMMLEILLIRYCYELEHIIDIGDGNDRKKCDAIFPKLKQFSVHDCFRLKCMFGEYPLDHDDFKDIHIHLHVLEKLTLENLPNFSLSSMTWPPLKEFTVNQCPKFIINNLIGHKTINLDSRKPISTEELKEVANLFGTLKNLSIIYNEVHNIICLSGVEIIGQVRLGLQYLKLYELHKLRHICLGSSINSFMFQNLKTIQIVRCYNLEVIFPASVLSYLPELERLEINKCHELKQIIEVAEDSAEDRKEIVTSSLIFSPRPQRPPCFQKLAVLVIHDCPKLKCLIPATQDVPNLVLLIVCEAFVLEELIGGGGEHITGRDELPKLEGVMCMLSESLCDRGIELQTVKHRVIDSCPNLSHFSSTATVQEIKEKYSALLKDFEINWAYWRFISAPDEDTRVENADDEATIHLPVSP